MAILISDISLSMTNFTILYRGNLFNKYIVASGFKTGGFCVTFKISGGSGNNSTNQRHYAYRVPHAINANLAYQQDVIDNLKQINSNYFVEFGEEAKSLLVDGQLLDVTYMEWIEGLTLGDYIQANYKNKVLISNLAKNFLDLIVWLHQNKISHGDLNDSNIMVRPNGSLVLIDYDTLCFSSIEGKYPELSNGKANYQHPSRMQGQGNKLSLQADYFSELVIYLSVLALAENPNLFNYVSVGDSLLFKKEDFVDFQQSKIYSELIKLSNEIIELTALLLNCCQTSNYLTLRFLPDYYTLKQLSNEINAHQNSVANLANAQKQLSAQINNFTQQFNQINHQYQQVIVNPNLNSALHDLSNLTKNCQTIQNQINQAQTDAKQNANNGNFLVQQIQQLDLNINVNHQTLRQKLLNLQQLKNKLVSNINLTSIQQQEQQLKQLDSKYKNLYNILSPSHLNYQVVCQLINEINSHQNAVTNLANAQTQLSAQINNFTQQFNQINHQYQQVIVNPNLNSALHDLSNLTKNCQTIQNQINQAQTDAKQNANKGNFLVKQIQQLDLNINVNHQTLRQELLNLQQLKNELVSNINLTSIQQQEQQLKQLAIDYNSSYGSFASTSLFFQQLDQLIKKINTHQNTITNLANAQKQLNTQISNSTQQVVQLNQKCQQSSKLSHNSKELDILKQEFTSLKQEFNQIKINQLVQEDNQLKRQQNDLFQQISTLTPQVDHLVKSVTVASLIALPTQLTSQIDQIFTKYKNITIYDQQLDPSLRNLIDLSQDTENLINQFFNDYPQLLILVGQINTYNSSVTILNKELAGQLTYEYNKLTNEASDIRTKRLQAVAEWKANQNQLNTIDKKIQDLHYQIQQTAGKSASLTSQIHPLSQQNYVLIQQVNQSISNETLLTADKDNLSLTQQKLTQELDQLTKLAQENTQWWNNGGEKNIQILQQKVSKFNPVNNPVTYLQQLDKKRQKLIHSKLTDWLYCLFNLINLVVILSVVFYTY